MNICCLLIVANNVGRVLYANNVSQLLYVVFAPPAKCQHYGQTAPPQSCYECQISSDSIYFVFSFAVGENSKHRNGISHIWSLILIFIVICHFWRFICFVWFDSFCSIFQTWQKSQFRAPGTGWQRLNKTFAPFAPWLMLANCIYCLL